MAIRVTDLKFDNAQFKNQFMLTDIQPYYEYVNGEKTNNLVGFKYNCALPAFKMEKLNVKVEGKIPLFDLEKEGMPEDFVWLKFENLQVGSYFMNKQIHIKATADGVDVMK